MHYYVIVLDDNNIQRPWQKNANESEWYIQWAPTIKSSKVNDNRRQLHRCSIEPKVICTSDGISHMSLFTTARCTHYLACWRAVVTGTIRRSCSPCSWVVWTKDTARSIFGVDMFPSMQVIIITERNMDAGCRLSVQDGEACRCGHRWRWHFHSSSQKYKCRADSQSMLEFT